MNDLPPFIAGPATLPVVYRLDVGTEVVGVRLRCGTAPRLLGIGAKELLNLDIPLRAVWFHDRCLPWLDALVKETTVEKLGSVQAAVTHRLASTEDDDAFVRWAALWLARHPSGRVDETDRLGGLGERQVRRRFDRAVGYVPKQLQRILRLQFVIWLASQTKALHPGLAGLSFPAG